IVSKIRLGQVSPWLFTNHPIGESAGPRRLHLESGAPLSGLGRRDRVALLPLPLVRRSQGAAPGVVAEIPLDRERARFSSRPIQEQRPAGARWPYGLPS